MFYALDLPPIARRPPLHRLTSRQFPSCPHQPRAEKILHACRKDTFFRTFKQTFGRTKLRSRSSANAELELDWSLAALWSICLLGQCELLRSGERPSQLSAASAIRAVQSTLRDYRVRPESADETLSALLAASLLDGYRRDSSKTSRDYPRKKKRERTAAPNIIAATTTQIATATEVKTINRKIRLAA